MSDIQKLKDEIGENESPDRSNYLNWAIRALMIWWKVNRNLKYITILGGSVFSILTAWIAYNTYVSSENQNELIQLQNKIIREQNILQESQRRSTYVLLLENLMDAVDFDLQNDSSLSESTYSKTSSLNSLFEPYHLMGDSGLMVKKASPERSMLFQLISTRRDINQSSLERFFVENVFSDLILNETVYKNLNWSYTSIRNSTFFSARFEEMQFHNAFFNGVTFDNSIIRNSLIQKCSYSNSKLYGMIERNKIENSRFSHSSISFLGKNLILNSQFLWSEIHSPDTYETPRPKNIKEYKRNGLACELIGCDIFNSRLSSRTGISISKSMIDKSIFDLHNTSSLIIDSSILCNPAFEEVAAQNQNNLESQAQLNQVTSSRRQFQKTDPKFLIQNCAIVVTTDSLTANIINTLGFRNCLLLIDSTLVDYNMILPVFKKHSPKTKSKDETNHLIKEFISSNPQAQNDIWMSYLINPQLKLFLIE